MSVLRTFQQREVLLTGDSRGSQIIHDDEYRHGSIARDDDRSRDARFRIDAMVTFLSDQREARKLKHAAQALKREGRDSRHVAGTTLERQFHLFGCDERWGAPVCARGITRDEPLFTKDLLQGAHSLALFEKEADGLWQSLPGFFDGVPATGHAQLWTVTDKRVAFLEDERGKRNLTHRPYNYNRLNRTSQLHSNPLIGTTSPGAKLDVAGNLAVRKGDKLLLDADDATADTYLIRNTGATTVSWFVDGVELAVFKKQTEVR